MSIDKIPQWYAFFTRAKHEKKVNETLQNVGVETFLPLKKSLNQWKDRRKWVEAPLFSSYVFAKISYINRYDVLKTPSVISIVSFNNKPSPVRPDEIEAIKALLASGANYEVINGMAPGDAVHVRTGPLAGIDAVISEIRGKRNLVLKIPMIGKSIVIDSGAYAIDKMTAA